MVRVDDVLLIYMRPAFLCVHIGLEFLKLLVWFSRSKRRILVWTSSKQRLVPIFLCDLRGRLMPCRHRRLTSEFGFRHMGWCCGSYHIISYHIIPYDMISYHIISYHIISYHIISYHITSYHIISHNIISHHISSYIIMP